MAHMDIMQTGSHELLPCTSLLLAAPRCHKKSFQQLLVIPGRAKPNMTPIWGFPKVRGTFFGGPHNKDYSILGSILGSPLLGKLPYNPIITQYNLNISYSLRTLAHGGAVFTYCAGKPCYTHTHTPVQPGGFRVGFSV